ncbi:MAG: adenine deaminase [Desulfonatronovibrionaceae bacterium]
MQTVKGIILDPVRRERFRGEIRIENQKITEIKRTKHNCRAYILPGFVDAHVHIESSRLVPFEFAQIALKHGTVATVSDPHEITNVCGVQGLDFMIDNGRRSQLKFAFGVPSCVPATPFETSGANLDADTVADLLKREDLPYLSEMMNWPGVLSKDHQVMAKIRAALDLGKPVDGHAPGLTGKKAAAYISAGISTDHECSSLQEALDKLEYGMKIIIREGSAARNFNDLIPILKSHPGRIMFCSDDKHAEDLLQGHINKLAARAIACGYDLMDTLTAACVTPVRHYGLGVGLLQEGQPADFVLAHSPEEMDVFETWIDGKQVYAKGQERPAPIEIPEINNFHPYSLHPEDFRVTADKAAFPVIEVREGSLVTGKSFPDLTPENGEIPADPKKDILKIAVVNRYEKRPPATGFVRGFGIRKGAIASSVAHDSHNIVVVGTSDKYLSRAVNMVMRSCGGIAASGPDREDSLPLPVAGLMTKSPGPETAAAYKRLHSLAREMGSPLRAPYMELSFMALLVIPSLKISDKGLFDAEKFEFIT